MRNVLWLGIIACFVLLSGGVALAGERVIVTFDENSTLVERANVVMLNGGKVIKHLGSVDGIVLTLPNKASDKARAAILAHNKVVTLVTDVAVTASKPGKGGGGGGKKPKTPPPQEIPWGVDRVDAELAWGTSTGADMKVAIIDTGIDVDHPDLSVAGGVSCVSYTASYNDDAGHGTHCAGIVAAVDNEIGVVGIAPEAQLYAVKVLDNTGSGYLSDVIEGLDWCAANGMDVASMSLGIAPSNLTAAADQLFHAAITDAYAAGVVLVASAGNSSGGAVDYPGAYPETIAVSATGQKYRYRKYIYFYPDELASYSSVGPEVDLAAPGSYVLSTYNDGAYTEMSGTSMACPHVSGTVALMKKAGRSLDYLFSTADDINLLPEEQGSGLLDAEEAATGVQTNP